MKYVFIGFSIAMLGMLALVWMKRPSTSLEFCNICRHKPCIKNCPNEDAE